MKNKKIIIVGAARSGTHLIGRLLRENIENYKYFDEVREVWEMALHTTSQSDVITNNMYNQSGIEKIGKYFKNSVVGDAVFIEKTANNCFRLPLVYDVFPDAYFIHIIRDGRDVAISARKKMQGDIRSISKVGNKDISMKSRLDHLLSIAKHKIKYVSYRNLKRYSLGVLSELGLLKNTLWGPRFIGMEEASKVYTPLQLSALQWKLSVDSVQSFFANKNNTKYMEIKFEDLVEHPDGELKDIFKFLNIECRKIKCDFIEKALLSKIMLSPKEESEINEIQANLLEQLGYKVDPV